MAQASQQPSVLLQPDECVLLLVDLQAGLGFGMESMPRQELLNNAVAVARTAQTFGVPVIATTSASKVYSGPLFPQVKAVLQGDALERRNMNAWEDDAVRAAVLSTGRKHLLVARLLTEACVSFPVLSALSDGFTVSVVADACGGFSPASHRYALDRMQQAGAHLTSWLQLLLELQRDWTRYETYEAARSIVVDNGGGYGMGLAFAREMIHPA